ncbi:MAG: MalY/PatB family protein [Bacteroidales bacterium]|nr:MalY/PatB family protein [Bacteroidales bacterium]
MTQPFDFDRLIDRRGTDATKYAELAEKYGRTDLLPLWIADMDFATPTEITDALVDCVRCPVLGYTTPPASLWQSIASWLGHRHGWHVSPDEVDYVPGVKKALGLSVNYFTRPGDKILIQPPVYHSFHSVIEGNGRRVITNPLVFDGETYAMDLDGLEHIVADEHPTMMIVCNPHNPVGIQWDADTLRRVASICYRYGVLLLSDEIYADLVIDGSRHIPTASVSSEAAEITVTLGAPSKTFNLPGIAAAWTVVQSPELRRGWFDWLHASEFDTPPVAAIYSTIAAYTRCEEWLDALLPYLADNCGFATRFIADNMPGVKAVMPNAGFGLWIDFRDTGLSHEALTDMLVNVAAVAVSDGASFGTEGTGFVRLNVGVPRSVLAEGLGRIARALAAGNTSAAVS